MVPAYFGETPLLTFANTVSDWSGSDGNGSFQFRAVIEDTANQGNVLLVSALATTFATLPLGILANTPKGAAATPDTAQIVTIGETKVLLGGTVAYGDPLTVDNVGRLVKWTTGATKTIIGKARMPGVSGDVITALVNFTSFQLNT